ncbi:Metalloendopeptidase-like membrane protein precursor [Sphingomonas paucimobilis]|nr:Metalloendopeptidase-like membrane protein precursor [Sphingomonas paucimobilis]
MKLRLVLAALAITFAAAPSPGAPQEQASIVLQGQPVQGGILTGAAPPGTVELRLDDQIVPVDVDDRFLIGFDRDAPAQARLAARLADGRTIDRLLSVAPGAWRIERVNAPLRPVRDNEAFLALRRPELAQIAAARAKVTGAQGWRQKFLWPRIGRISGLFGSQRIYQGVPGSYHGGIDIAGSTGQPVFAPADGVVILAADRPFTLEGRLLMIDHGHGLSSAFLHLSGIDVKTGDTVRQGQRIGSVGSTGRATGPHLHWGLRWNDARVDPLLAAGPMPAL